MDKVEDIKAKTDLIHIVSMSGKSTDLLCFLCDMRHNLNKQMQTKFAAKGPSESLCTNIMEQILSFRKSEMDILHKKNTILNFQHFH